MNKKMALVLTVCLIGILVLAGCTRTTVTPTPSPVHTPLTSPLSSIAPVATPSVSPEISPPTSPMVSSAPTTGADAAANLENAKKIEGELDKLSEIGKSVVLVNEQKALVAVEFESAYKGEMTDRIKEMITEKVKAVDSQITDVTVTDDPAMLTDIKEVRSKVDGGSLIEDIKAEFEKLVQRLKPAV